MRLDGLPRRLLAAAACVAVLTGTAALAQTGDVRLPRPRPVGSVPVALPTTVPPAPETPAPSAVPETKAPSAAPEQAVAPLPPAANAAQALDSVARLPRARPQPGPDLAYVSPTAPAETEVEAPVPLGADGAACLARLRSLGVEFTEEDPLGVGGCAVPHPLNVTSLGGGIALSPAAILNCRTTEALALWARDVVRPAARRELNAEPKRVVHASTYVCRPRNNQAGAKLSEHARANAVDIASIDFAGREALDIRARGSAAPDGRFQSAIRKGSCRYFTTVLGPGSDAAHATHLHFDMAERRGGYRLCD